MRLQICIQVAAVLCLFMVNMHAVPLIQSIVNNSDIGFIIVSHSDKSACSLAGSGVVIAPQSTFDHEFLLESGAPSVVLRPAYFLDPVTGEIIRFIDDNYQIISAQLAKAYNQWRTFKGTKKFDSPELWLDNWIGSDILIEPHEVEVLGYLLNLSRVMSKNNKNEKKYWLSYSKGIFSKLALELVINQKIRKGIRVSMQVHHSEGAVCRDGVIERLSAAPIIGPEMP
jgi:hypothetical protein